MKMKGISYLVKSKKEFKEVVEKQLDGWEITSHSDMYNDGLGNMKVDVFYKLRV